MKSPEKRAEEFYTIMAENGFEPNGEVTYDGRKYLSRKWTRESDVAFYGKSESSLEVTMMESGGIPVIYISRNGRRDRTSRDYSSAKRAMNAIREIVENAGYKFES